jgi:hypothetical protein
MAARQTCAESIRSVTPESYVAGVSNAPTDRRSLSARVDETPMQLYSSVAAQR